MNEHSTLIDDEYVSIIQDFMKCENDWHLEAMALACKLMKGPSLTPDHLHNFLLKVCSENSEFNELHTKMKTKIENEFMFSEISEVDATKLYDHRQSLITEISKSGRFKEMFEEIYALIITDGSDKFDIQQRKDEA